jgi:hypothetical protein
VTSVARRAAHFERVVRADLVHRRWLRWHAFWLGAVCFLSGWAISTGLMHAGIERLSLRWGLALAGAYLIYLVLLRLLCGWLLSRDEADADLQLDGFDLPSPGRGEPATGDVVSGAGGDFGGGGASGSFDAGDGGTAVGDMAGEAAGGVLEAAGSADEGIVVIVPLAVVVGVAALIAGALSVAVFGLFGVNVLLGVAVEIAFAAAGGALAFRAGREGWLQHATSRTAYPLVAILLLCVMLGAAIDHWLPQANSLPQAIRALRG